MSLKSIGMPLPHSLEEWRDILQTLVEKNGSGNWALYLQVTRGVDPIRKQAFSDNVQPTIFAICFPNTPPSKEALRKGYKAWGVEDIRWRYCQIKTTARLAYILMFEQARQQAADEGIIIHEGYALEGTSSNFFMVKDGLLITPEKSTQILSGIIRDVILQMAIQDNIPVQERKVMASELEQADELWITSSVRGIYPIIEYNGRSVGTGFAGALWERMWDLYDEECNRLSLPISN